MTPLETALDLYKFYWGIALKVSAFYFLGVGSLVAFYVAHLSVPCVNLIPWFILICSGIAVVLGFISVGLSWSFNAWFSEYVKPGEKPIVAHSLIGYIGAVTVLAALITLYSCRVVRDDQECVSPHQPNQHCETQAKKEAKLTRE